MEKSVSIGTPAIVLTVGPKLNFRLNFEQKALLEMFFRLLRPDAANLILLCRLEQKLTGYWDARFDGILYDIGQGYPTDIQQSKCANPI